MFEDADCNPQQYGGYECLETQLCLSNPRDVKKAIMEVRQIEYHIMRWNCQHFARHLLTRLSRSTTVPCEDPCEEQGLGTDDV
mmetsp:Transcript_30065/g.79188  ORF Transcript_30065/g.79188 Transcript_30065/m.79188 type:complete len:83 (+) Transcript_30065:3-251(+)